MVHRSRRRFLQASAAAVAVGSAGCLGGSSPAQKAAQRRIDHGTTPPAGTWPTADYDARGTRHNPDAALPRSAPATEWSVSFPGVASSVIVGPEFVYASSDEATVAVTPDGTEQWRVEVGGGLTYVAGRLYVTDDDLVALDAESGDEIWRASDGEGPNAVFESRGTVYVTERTRLRGFHADSGEERWRIETDRYPRLVADDGQVAVVTGRRVRFLEPGEVEDGLFREPEPQVVETLEPGWYPEIIDATLVDGSFYLGQFGDSVADLNATARKFDLMTDDERWVTPFDWSGVGAIAVDDERVYAAPYRATLDPMESAVVALDRETGTEVWHDDGELLGSPTVGGDVVVAGGAHPGSPSVCVSKSDGAGTEEDETETERTCSEGEPAAESGVLRAFDAATGESLWTVEPGASYGSYPIALAGERLYLGDADGVHAFA
ncbi:PQQ-binding-like beta-propeller repeat protein [Halolamina sp. CBA1230]|uniref:outer membrane protein assembly factor BamB family protein n=1 Tax=Halolamina sp. CBA1230 TaxID=1853690 RepID=UPI0009A199CC|nr:PQQ-binding-like beta-propeller repeat protein [Halolamina sp. CBA1230]QKY19223.1 PQQ-binding-like beta-propeller repeat protein [Halolamina sp. CBA1230]